MRKILFIIFSLITLTSYSQGVRGVLAARKVVRGAQPEVYVPDYIAQYYTGDSVNGFGNSIMIGIGSTPGSSTDWLTYTSGYMHKIRDTFGVIVNNYALSGMGVKPMVTEFYKYGDSTNSDDHLILAGGYNDLRHRGGESDTLVPNQIYWGYNAAIANQFLKEWIVAGAATTSGSWTNLNANMNGKGKSYYSGNASFEGLQSSHGTTYFSPPSASYTATGRYFVVGFVASDGSPTYEKNSFHIDTNGVLYTTVNPNYQTSGAGPAWDVPQYEMPAAIVVDAGRSASHTIRVRPVTEGKVSLFDYFGVLNDTDAVKSVVILEIPKQTSAGYVVDASFDNANDSVIMLGIYKQRQVADEWRNRGYPVAIARTNDYFNPSIHMQADLIHPNNTGQQVLFQVLQTVIDSATAPGPSNGDLLARFNFNATAQSVSGWTDVSGEPHSGVRSATSGDITVSSLTTSEWNPFSISAHNTNGEAGGTYFNSTVMQSFWVNYSFTWASSADNNMRISGLTPGQTYTLKISGSWNTAISGSLDGTNTCIRVNNGSCNEFGANDNTANGVQVTGTADGSGYIYLWIGPGTGGNGGFISGMEIYFGTL